MRHHLHDYCQEFVIFPYTRCVTIPFHTVTISINGTRLAIVVHRSIYSGLIVAWILTDKRLEHKPFKPRYFYCVRARLSHLQTVIYKHDTSQCTGHDIERVILAWKVKCQEKLPFGNKRTFRSTQLVLVNDFLMTSKHASTKILEPSHWIHDWHPSLNVIMPWNRLCKCSWHVSEAADVR